MESNGDNLSIRVASFSYYLDTAKENLVQRISAQDPPFLVSPGKTISNSTKPPLHSNSKEDQDIKNLRVDSFSYLNKAGENFVFKLPNNPINDSTNAFSFSHQNNPKENNEISVFGADKYFKMKLEYDNQKLAKLPHPTFLGLEARTPSLCSEATSLNSQTALLRRDGSQTRQRKTLARRFFTGFGCQSHCFDRKDVHVNHILVPVDQTGSRRINHHASGVVVPSTGREISTIMEPIKADHHFRKPEKVLDEPRHSIEVFGSNAKIKDNLAKNMEMKLSMLTWDAIPKTSSNQFPTLSSTICDDMASDASSDLFEIEHLSASLHESLSKLDVPDDMSICTSPQSHYAPSEASIQWSVVTASAADYSSVLYEHDDEMSASVAGDRVFATNKSLGSKNAKTRSGGAKETLKSPRVGLLGCKSIKAVNVAENVSQKANEKAKKQEVDSFVKTQSNRGRVQQQDVIGTRDLPTTFVNDGL